jgi:hypothetical protein
MHIGIPAGVLHTRTLPFTFGKFSNGKTILLRMFALFKIRRHKLIAGAVNPFTHIGVIISVKESCAGF